MIKIYFRSLFTFVDQVSKDKLHQIIHKLIEEYEQLEFWFVSCRTDFDSIVIQIITDMRKQYPNKQIDIVAVTDPFKHKYETVEEFPEEDYRFPTHSVTKLQEAPLIQGKCEQYPDRYLVHFKKVEKWILEQCDLVIAFFYEEIPNPLTFEMQRLKKKKEVIPIFNPDVAQELLAQIELLDEKQKNILLGLKNGRTYTSLAEEYKISRPRVQQLAKAAGRRLFREIEKQYT